MYMIGGFWLSYKVNNINYRREKKGGKRNTNNNRGNAFKNSRIANFSDDPVSVLGWKGTGFLVILIILGYIIFQLLLN